MKFYITIACLVIYSVLFGQKSKIDSTSFYSVSLDRDIPTTIYKPANYSDTRDPYRVYIYLHGAEQTVDWPYASFMKPILDKLISNNQIDPILVVFPIIKFKTVHSKAIPYDLHFYADSERNGKYESVISVDLIDWLSNTYNVSTRREHWGIGGFSMGAAACVTIAIRNSDKFIACIAHDGRVSMKSNLIDLPLLLAETPGLPYEFKISNGFYSAIWFGFSAAFSPNMTNANMPEWFFDFPIDNQGNVIDSVFTEKWVANHDPATFLQNLNIYKNEIAIYFDASDDGKPYNNIFHSELSDLGIPHTYNTFSGRHGIYDKTVEAGLLFLDAAMDAAITEIDQKNNQIIRGYQLFDNYPNPFNTQTTILYSLNRTGKIKLEIYNTIGQKVKTLIDEWKTAGDYQVKWDGRDEIGNNVVSGLYIYKMDFDNFSLAKKMLMLK